MARMVQLSPEEVDIELAKVREPNHMTMTWTTPLWRSSFWTRPFQGSHHLIPTIFESNDFTWSLFWPESIKVNDSLPENKILLLSVLNALHPITVEVLHKVNVFPDQYKFWRYFTLVLVPSLTKSQIRHITWFCKIAASFPQRNRYHKTIAWLSNAVDIGLCVLTGV